tara:strand:- start:1294 stop:1866 length:573 start_codon:yes stop_codon:yes gene_type:complete
MTKLPLDALSALDALSELYASAAASRLYDEAITELQHALQCAELATAAGESDALVAAALLHDVGHLLLDDQVGLDEVLADDYEHEKAGARYLAPWFGPEVTGPVALHVAAKRYLCAVEPSYFATLSPSSVRTLAVQGGAMTADEVDVFERHPGSRGAVLVRRWDDMAKVPGRIVAGFDHYVDVLRTVAIR